MCGISLKENGNKEKKMKARCMRCRAQMEMKDMIQTKTKRGVPMIKGICVKCGCKMAIIGKTL